MRLPRFVHRWYADLACHFWLPCPLCGEMFGGHEWDPWAGDCVRIGDYRGEGCCPPCGAKYRHARRDNGGRLVFPTLGETF